jgi:hypothetical protein
MQANLDLVQFRSISLKIGFGFADGVLPELQRLTSISSPLDHADPACPSLRAAAVGSDQEREEAEEPEPLRVAGPGERADGH